MGLSRHSSRRALAPLTGARARVGMRLALLLLWLGGFGCTSAGRTCNKGCEAFVQKKLRPRAVFTEPGTGKKLEVTLELACTPAERQQGLMYRKSMPETQGMLFIFPYEQIQSFWMKNTYIPLDMIHINKNKEIVGIVENAKPHDETSRSVGKPALYVLEVNAFYARKNGVHARWKVEFLEIPQCGS